MKYSDERPLESEELIRDLCARVASSRGYELQEAIRDLSKARNITQSDAQEPSKPLRTAGSSCTWRSPMDLTFLHYCRERKRLESCNCNLLRRFYALTGQLVELIGKDHAEFITAKAKCTAA